MKYTTILTFFALFVLLSVPTFAQEEEGDVQSNNQDIVEETHEEKRARMLEAFDEEYAQKGFITLSFTEDITTKEQALAIVKSYKLTLQQTKLCAQIADPNSDPEELGCTVEDSWHDFINSGTFVVKKGTNLKKLADTIVSKEANVIWAEPAYEVSTALDTPTTGEDVEEVEQATLETGFLEGIATSIMNWFGSWFR